MNRAKKNIDLNADLGEGIGNEADLMPYLSSCNIACGGHAGDRQSIRSALVLAREHRVKPGAHPSYPDRENFGRKSMQMSPREFSVQIESQVGEFARAAAELNIPWYHIKAHGALYNDLAHDRDLSDRYLEVLRPYRERIRLYGPCGSGFVGWARNAGYKIWEEAFADRGYSEDGSLAPRQLDGAVLSKPQDVWQQLREMVVHQRVKTLAGSYIPIDAQTYCLHGDTPGALEILMYLSDQLSSESISIDK